MKAHDCPIKQEVLLLWETTWRAEFKKRVTEKRYCPFCDVEIK